MSLIGVMEEIGRRGADELSVEWRIPNFPSLLHGTIKCYISPAFRIGNGRWELGLWPNCGREARNPASGWVKLALFNSGESPTFRFSVGIRGSGGVEKSREGESLGRCFLDDFCSRSYLLEHRTRLMPEDTLIIRCVLKRSCAARGAGSLPHPSTQVAPTDRSQSSDKRGDLPSDVLVTYSYKELQTATRNFGDLPLRAGGCKIGERGFGTVYRAIVRGNVVAVKRLKDHLDTQFITELKTFTNYKHENLVQLLGFSIGPNCCLVYEYMPNGSLEDRLACKDGSEPLSWQTRLFISYGTALGINHLHTFGEKPMVHRDIKSANILLDQYFVAKVGDFDMVRTGSSGESTTMSVTKTRIGTPGYMPPEALYDVSVQWDTFSFGVVLLELLTGLPPYDPNRRFPFLIAHMENSHDIRPRLDPKAKWNEEAAKKLYRITQRCLAKSKKSRPYFSEILEDLINCVSLR